MTAPSYVCRRFSTAKQVKRAETAALAQFAGILGKPEDQAELESYAELPVFSPRSWGLAK